MGNQEEARRDLFSSIEGYYNRARMHSALGYLTPEEAEMSMAGCSTVSTQLREDHQQQERS
jgi:transposase InsO family protein